MRLPVTLAGIQLCVTERLQQINRPGWTFVSSRGKVLKPCFLTLTLFNLHHKNAILPLLNSHLKPSLWGLGLQSFMPQLPPTLPQTIMSSFNLCWKAQSDALVLSGILCLSGAIKANLRLRWEHFSSSNSQSEAMKAESRSVSTYFSIYPCSVSGMTFTSRGL